MANRLSLMPILQLKKNFWDVNYYNKKTTNRMLELVRTRYFLLFYQKLSKDKRKLAEKYPLLQTLNLCGNTRDSA